MSIAVAKWTLDDYHHMIRVGLLDDRPVELLNGWIIEMSPEGPEHAQKSTNAADYLRAHLGTRALIREGKPITIPNNGSEPEPDIAVVAPNREVYCDRHPHPEEIYWLIEYANTSLQKDVNIKRQTYASAGIQDYWVIDLKHSHIRVFSTPKNGDYQSDTRFTQGQISPSTFPDLAVDVTQFL